MTPAAQGGGLRRAWEVLVAMTTAALRQDRDFTPLGVMKWLIEPLLFTGVYLVLLVAVRGRTGNVPLLFLVCALLPYRFFTGVAGGGLSLVARHSSILVNRSFPRSVLPLVLLSAEGLTFCISLLLFVPFMAYYEIPPTPALLWLPVILAILALLSSGLTFLTAVLGLYFPDFRALVQSLLRVAFFVSTALAPARRAGGDAVPRLLDANPLSGIFDSIRAVVIGGRSPQSADLLYPFAAGVVLLAVGVSVYRWREPHFAKEV